MKKIAVIGAGITGISVAYFLRKAGYECVVYEKNPYLGGLASSFVIDGFTFDRFVHLGFSKDETVNSVLLKDVEIVTHPPELMSYHKDKMIKHPIQNNLFQLDVDERIKAVKSLISRPVDRTIENYEDWLKVQYGEYFAEEFPMRYTRKYWTVDAKELDTDWVSVRMYVPKIEEVLLGAFSMETPKAHYVDVLRYPKEGGFFSFLKTMTNHLCIQCGYGLIKIDTKRKELSFSNGIVAGYDHLVSTVPLPEVCRMLPDAPESVRAAGENLDYTSGVLISLGFNRPNVVPHLASYIYDESILAARIHSPSIKSSSNAPANCSSLVAEVYYSKHRPLEMTLDEVLEKTIDQLGGLLGFSRKDIRVKHVESIKYANVMFRHGISENRATIHEYLREQGVGYAGRFGDWDYLWSDQSFLSGKRIADELVAKLKENP